MKDKKWQSDNVLLIKMLRQQVFWVVVVENTAEEKDQQNLF